MNRGISRKLRLNDALAFDHILMDERSMQDFVNATLHLAQNISYYDYTNKVQGDWEPFFLEDSIFVIAKIAATPIDGFKKQNDALMASNGHQMAQDAQTFVSNFFALPDLVVTWNDLLKKARYEGPLLEEIHDLRIAIGHSLRQSHAKAPTSDVEQKQYDQDLSESFNKRRMAFVTYDAVKKQRSPSTADIQVRGEVVPSMTIFEAFDDIYGKVVFFKEQVAKKFVAEIAHKHDRLPHIGLLLTFFKLFQLVQNDVNSLTKRHLDYYYHKVLRQTPQVDVKPHTTMVSCLLNSANSDHVLPEGSVFDFDLGDGQQIEFQCEDETVLNQTIVTDVKTIFKSDVKPFDSKFDIDVFHYNMLHGADVLKSIEERNEMLTYSHEDFPLIFGGETSDQVEVGFMVSAPILILEKGKQTVNVEFGLTHDLFNDESPTPFNRLIEAEFKKFLKDRKSSRQKVLNAELERERIKEQRLFHFFSEAFSIYITHEDGWKRLDFYNTTYQDRVVKINMPLTALDEEMVVYDATVHGGDYDTHWPCIKILLNNYATYHPYVFLKFWQIDYLKIDAKVTDVKTLSLSNSNGAIDGSIPFEPFGSIPEPGSFLRIQHPLILQRNLSSLELTINWNGLPQIGTDYHKLMVVLTLIILAIKWMLEMIRSKQGSLIQGT